MRVFIAIEFNDVIKEYLWQQLQLIKEYTNKGNFTLKENFHLTLNFIGEVTLGQIDMLQTVLDSAAINLHPYILNFNKLGRFSRGNTNILWIGTNKSTELESTFNNLNNSLKANGFPIEKRGLNPHITLGREVNLKVSFEELSPCIHIQPKEISVNKISLMESARINGVLRYLPIHTSNF